MRRTSRSLVSFVLFAVFPAVACGSGSSTTGAGGGSGSLTGTLGGETFVLASGLGNVGKGGALALILSDSPGVCDSIQAKKLHSGETIVQLYGLTGSAPGAFKPATDDVKYASVSATCASGNAIEQSVVKKGRATKSDLTISKLTATEVEGTMNLTFDDGSSVSGSFSVPICPTAEAEHSVCY